MTKAIVAFAILIASGISSISCVRILGVFPVPSLSHQVVYRALLKELNSRGHEIVIITPDPINNTSLQNYTQIDVSALYKFWKQRFNFVDMEQGTQRDFALGVLQPSSIICRMVFENPEVTRLIKDDKFQFDLVIAEWLITPCMYAFSYRFSAPLIGISSLGLFYSAFDSIGNPTHATYFADIFYPPLRHPNFWEKLYRLSYFIWFRWFWHTSVLQPHDKLARQYFGNSLPFLGDLEKNVSLLFTNMQLNMYFVSPKVPALIELGQMHLKEINPLPKDLQEFMDGADAGVIYFSLGTNVRCEHLPEDKVKMFIDVFSHLNDYRILWKWDKDKLPGKPSNVMVGKWFPQQDVLAHPKIKAFIFQGGLQSLEEAIRAQVPVIGFPFFGDQEMNIQLVTTQGIGEHLHFNEVTRELLLSTLNKIIYEPKYKINLKKVWDIMNDQPQKPLEKAVWWTEYVIRHKGARHLRSGALDIPWYEYYMLDVITFIIVSFVLSLWATYCLLQIIMENFQRRIKSKEKPE